MSENYNFLHSDGYVEPGVKTARDQVIGCIVDFPYGNYGIIPTNIKETLDFWIGENAWKDKELAALNKQIIEKDEEIKYLRRLILEREYEWN